MMQIKHFTALPKMPYFQFPRRPENGPWRSKILSASPHPPSTTPLPPSTTPLPNAARKKLLIKAILSLVSYSVDKAFHFVARVSGKIIFFCEIEWAVSHKLLTE